MERDRAVPRCSLPGMTCIGALALLASGCAPGAQGDCTSGPCVEKAACTAGQASAQFVSQKAPPDIVSPWQREPVSVRFANCSGQTWTPGDFTLRPARGVALPTWSVPEVPLPFAVPDGYSVRVPFAVLAPAVSGEYPFAWAIAHEGVEVYEEPSPTVMVRVSASSDCSAPGPPARFRGQLPPSALLRTGAPIAARVTLANCSTATWRASDPIALSSRGTPEDAWGPRSLALPFDVPPEREVTA